MYPGFRVLDAMRVADQRLRVVCGRQKWCTISVKSRIRAAVLFVVLNISRHFCGSVGRYHHNTLMFGDSGHHEQLNVSVRNTRTVTPAEL